MARAPLSDSGSGRLLADMDGGNNAPPLSVSEISGALKRVVEDRFGHVRIRGELSGFKRPASGHLYFALKDEAAKIDGVMWKGVAGRLNFRPEDGLDVIVTGKLTTYAGRSSYQIVAESIELAGEGALMQLFEKLKASLAAEGLFAEERKRPLPRLPRVIGVVTSPTGAVIRDILHRLNDRFPVHVIVWPTLVQGEGAAAQVAAAVRGFSAMEAGGPVPRPDLVIVARGGGSIEDLWSFNEEIVVRAVAESTIPIISAVGHETDTTLCDYAADRRAPTPTAAAEMAVPVRAELNERVGQAGVRLNSAVHRVTSLAGERLEAQRRLLPKPADIVEVKAQRVDDLGERLGQALTKRAALAEGALARASGGFGPRLLSSLVARKSEQLAAQRLPMMLLDRRASEDQARLEALWRLAGQLHPDKPLSRGFARVTDREGRTLTSGAAAEKAGALTLRFADKAVDAVVDSADAPPPKPPRKSAAKGTPEGQGSLFG